MNVLRVMDEKHHQERNDGRGRVDKQLPCVIPPKQRARNEPRDNRERCHKEHRGLCHSMIDRQRETRKQPSRVRDGHRGHLQTEIERHTCS